MQRKYCLALPAFFKHVHFCWGKQLLAVYMQACLKQILSILIGAEEIKILRTGRMGWE